MFNLTIPEIEDSLEQFFECANKNKNLQSQIDAEIFLCQQMAKAFQIINLPETL